MEAKSLKEKSKWWLVLKFFLLLVLLIAFSVVGYFIYYFANYYRLPDYMELSVNQSAQIQEQRLKADEVHSITTYNIGFGAYIPSYSFFMDGGTESRAFSREECEVAVVGATNMIHEKDVDIALFQELDFDSTRSYHLDQPKIVAGIMKGYDYIFAQNYDSPYLFYPIFEPHGLCRAGMATFSKYPIEFGERYAFPVSKGLSRTLDLDRCFSVMEILLDNGKKLCVFNLHMSAYGADESIQQGQIDILMKVMKEKYEEGNYVIVGGDFNHDLGLAAGEQGMATWAAPFDRKDIPEHFSFAMDLLEPTQKDALGYTARNADIPYEKGVTAEFQLDGFIISDNVELVSYENVHTGYQFSDHDPVYMEFRLK